MAEARTDLAETAPEDEDQQKRRLRRRRKSEPVAGEPRTVRTSAIVSLLKSRPPDREQLEREAAAELYQAVSPALELLQATVPEASSPEEAQRALESKLGPVRPDPDAQLPSHAVYKGDALVYQQLRRHYGQPAQGGSFRRGWSPGEGLPSMLGG